MYLKKLRLYPTLFITFTSVWSEAGFGFLLKNLKNVLLMLASTKQTQMWLCILFCQ